MEDFCCLAGYKSRSSDHGRFRLFCWLQESVTLIVGGFCCFAGYKSPFSSLQLSVCNCTLKQRLCIYLVIYLPDPYTYGSGHICPGLSHACPINGQFIITPHLPGHQPLEVE